MEGGVFLQDYIYIYDGAGNLLDTVTQVIDANLTDRLDGTLTLDFTSKFDRLPEFTADTLIEFRGQYYRTTQVRCATAGNAFTADVSCEQESISLVDAEIEEFNFTGTADDALARLLDGTGITAIAEHTGTITISASGGNRRAVLLEIADLCEGEIEYSGHVIHIKKRRGRTDPFDIVSVCRCSDVSKSLDLRNGTESYELTGLNPVGYGVGDAVDLNFLPLGIQEQRRIIGISYNPFDCRSVSVEVGDYLRDITDDYASLEKIFLLKADASIEFEKYINSAEGTAGIKAALEGTYITQDALDGYVQTSELNAEVKAFLDGEDGIAAITSAVSGKFMEIPPSFEYSKPSAAAFGFTFAADGYYTSTNGGMGNTYSYGVFTFQNKSGGPREITLRCISYGESNYDYGIISTVNHSLSLSSAADTTNVLKSFKGLSSKVAVDVKVEIPAGTSTISFKYIKNSNDDLVGGDFFKIVPIVGDYVTKMEATSLIEQRVDEFGASLKLSVSNGQKSSTISLTGDGINLSGTVQFSGEVVFKSDLSTAGSTTINGANIMTGTLSADMINTTDLRVQKVWYYDANAEEKYFSVMSSEISGKSTVTRVGPKDIRNDYLQALELYGSAIYFVRAGKTASHSSSLLFDMEEEAIVPAKDDTWYIGTSNSSFNRIYLDTGVYLRDQDTSAWSRLYTDEDSLYWENGSGDKFRIV